MTFMKFLTFFFILAAASRILVDPISPQLISSATGFLSNQFNATIKG